MSRIALRVAGWGLVAALPLAGGVAAQTTAVPPAAANAEPTLAKLLEPGDPAKVAAAFKAICLDHPADADAQAKVATAPAWGFTPAPLPARIGRTFVNWPMQLVVVMAKTQGACLITSTVPDGTDPMAVGRTVGATLGPGEPTAAAKRETEVGWTYGDKRYPVRLDLHKAPGAGVMTISIETEGVW